MTDHAELNARAARLAGYRPKRVPAGTQWYSPRGAMCGLPKYCSSLDDIRCDLLPLLTKSDYAMDDFEDVMWRVLGPLSATKVLTADPAVIVAAIVEVLEEKS